MNNAFPLILITKENYMNTPWLKADNDKFKRFKAF